MTEERYHLYLAPFTIETAQIATTEKYARATPDYVMIYTKAGCPEGFKEMTEDDLHLLPDDGKKWLQGANITIIQQFIAEHMEEQEKARKKFMEAFEEELRAEREKLLQQKE